MFSKRPKGATVYSDKKKSGVAGLLWMLVASVITIIASILVYKSGYIISHEEEVIADTEPTIKPKKDADNYQFYDILPDQDMQSIPEAKIVDKKEKLEKNKDKDKEEFKPDVVVTEELKDKNSDLVKNSDNALVEDGQNPNIESKDSQKYVDGNVNGDNDMVIVYENSTYDGTPVKKTVKLIPEKAKNNEIDQSIRTMDGQKSPENINNPDDYNYNSNVDQSIYPTNTGPKINGPVNYTGERIGSIPDNNINSDTVDNDPINPDGQSKVSYILQINSYGNSYEADKRRAQVLMAGVDARVIKNSTGNNTAIYQVISNTMNSPSEVVQAQQKLQQNGIDSLIVEQRRK